MSRSSADISLAALVSEEGTNEAEELQDALIGPLLWAVGDLPHGPSVGSHEICLRTIHPEEGHLLPCWSK